MTTLADLLITGGVHLDYTNPTKPSFLATPAQRPGVEALLTDDARPETQRALRVIAHYRATILRLAASMAARTPVSDLPALQTEVALQDDLGPRLASIIRGQTLAEYRDRTKRCGRCGGPPHPEAEGK